LISSNPNLLFRLLWFVQLMPALPYFCIIKSHQKITTT
jgi:hypothetical protein